MIFSQGVIGLGLRALNLLLHLITIALIVNGILDYPKLQYPLVFYTITKLRITFWILLEAVYLLFTCGILIYSWIIPRQSSTSILSRLQFIIETKCPNMNFWGYLFLSTFVLYGSMVGCNIPLVFNKYPEYPDPTRSRLQSWQISSIIAIAASVLNAILYFIAAFVPLHEVTKVQPWPKNTSESKQPSSEFQTDNAPNADANLEGIGDDKNAIESGEPS